MKAITTKKSGPPARSEGYQAGLAMRKKVLGDDYVERSFANADDLNMPFQELATEFAWGKVWTRPGLTLKERSLATLSMCIALNRPAEIKIHLRGAVRNGVSREELRELILHSFLYCGGPAALDAYKAVRDELPLIEAAEKEAQKLARPAKVKVVKRPVNTPVKAKAKSSAKAKVKA
ncbi:carboxymuconolactone decarboxylase family protein [Limnohabitans sp. Rim8]|uniref:carboxymuconolactone decarboxylase family protein n=1 Tax=Limnohabitans sp. Rim8 TaxID=1100718 RepID=UPI0034581140